MNSSTVNGAAGVPAAARAAADAAQIVKNSIIAERRRSIEGDRIVTDSSPAIKNNFDDKSKLKLIKQLYHQHSFFLEGMGRPSMIGQMQMLAKAIGWPAVIRMILDQVHST